MQQNYLIIQIRGRIDIPYLEFLLETLAALLLGGMDIEPGVTSKLQKCRRLPHQIRIGPLDLKRFVKQIFNNSDLAQMQIGPIAQHFECKKIVFLTHRHPVDIDGK